MYNSISLTGLAASLADGLCADKPEHAQPPISALDNLIKEKTTNGKVSRILMYNPDGIGLWMYQKYTEWYIPLLSHIQLTLPLLTVMPSITPVCFATMYTGAPPETHGIQKGETPRPVLKCDSLFDAVLRAGKKCAIVTCDPACSMSRLYLERDMDYYFFDTVQQSNEKALELIAKDNYDLLCIYDISYDKASHGSWPESAEALAALRGNIAVFSEFALAAKKYWAKYDSLIGFAPDHGHHKDAIKGRGIHGTDMEEDVNILHFYGIQPAM